jgi:two-component system, chemotaxis family, protein-glutamate methylesterase/glutaminase
MSNFKVLVIDDSAFSRRTISKMLDETDGVEVVGYAVDGEDGIQKIISLKPDLVTIDLEMPKMDGFTLLRIIKKRFSIPVIVISALSAADKVFKALELGAFDFVAKPKSTASPELLQIRDDLQNKVRQVVKLKSDTNSEDTVVNYNSTLKKNMGVNPVTVGIIKKADHGFDVVAIGSSTGGPQALQSLFTTFDKQYPFSIVVSQHMPVGFTRAFADRLNRLSKFSVKEAEDGDPVLPGHILIAPGGNNLVFENCDGKVVARVVKPCTTDRFVPSVDVMLESCSKVFQNRVLAVILTGMGNDGARGVRCIKENGGYVISESEETSVVYGMPREAVATGVVDQVLPLHQVVEEILRRGAYL